MGSVNAISQVGKREDLADIVAVADAKNTPVTSMMKKGKKPTNALYSWQAGGVPEPDTTAIPDGKPVDNTEDMSGNRQMLYGRVHKIRRVPAVTELAEDVSTVAGIESEFKSAKANAILAVKRAIEAIFCGDQDSSLVGTTNTCRGLGSWISSTAQSDLPVAADYLTPASSVFSGNLSDLTEDDLRGIMQSIYEQTGQQLDLDGAVGTALKSAISKMTIFQDDVDGKVNVRTFFKQLDDNELSAKVDIIKGDFGTVRLFPTLWNHWTNKNGNTKGYADTKRGYFLDMENIEMCANKLPGFKPLPEDDSGPRGVVSAIVGMKVYNPLQQGAVKAA